MPTFDEYKNLDDKYIQKANKSWDDDYINFISSYKLKDSYWCNLTCNQNITFDMFLSHPELP